jgi:RNA polymerase sigma-32 factor
MNEEDLIQEGIVGLVEAVDKYDISKNVRLSSYAVYAIKAKVHDYVIRNFRMAKMNTNKAHRRLFFGLRKFVEQNHEYTMEDVAVRFKTDVGTARNMYERMFVNDLPTNVDPENPMSVDHLMCTDDIDYVELIESERDSKQLRSVVHSLNDRQQEVNNRRWLLDDKTTLQELATQYGVSCERVRQIELQGLDNIKRLILPQ